MNIYRLRVGGGISGLFSPSISFQEGTRVQGQNEKTIRPAAAAAAPR